MTDPRSPAKTSPMAKLGIALLAAAGLLLAVYLIADTGFEEVGKAFAGIGWGMALILLYDLAMLSFAGLAWAALTRSVWHGKPALFVVIRYVREAINSLLPVAQIGGDVIGARMLTGNGAPASVAAASIIADKTVEILGQLVYTIAGFLLLLGRNGESELTPGIGIGLLVAGPLFLGLLGLQHSSAFAAFERLLLKLADRLQWEGLGRMAGLHAALTGIYRQPFGLALGFALHIIAWVAGAGEVWLALHLMGYPLSFVDCFILESLGQAARSAAFIIPGGLGAQEGALLLIGGALGVPAEYALALSLVKRAAQLLFGIPMLAAWPFLERRGAARRLDSPRAVGCRPDSERSSRC
jgi:putative membrane protein